MKALLNTWGVIIIACLTIGLAPYSPEPHIVGKLRWIMGGAEGMALIDWGDFLFHGLPWILLIRLVVLKLLRKI